MIPSAILSRNRPPPRYIAPRLAGSTSQAEYGLRDSSKYITATGVKLLGDLSGNSNVNVLALNGAAGNYASTPDSAALSITGNIDIRGYVSLPAWTHAGSAYYVAGKWNTAGQRSYRFALTNATTLQLITSADGTANSSSDTSDAILTFANFSGGWVRVTRNSGTGQVKFYTSTDSASVTSPTWTQLGSTLAGTAGAIFDGTDALEIGTIVGGTNSPLLGNVYRVQIRNNILDDGTGIVFDADFAGAGKLAATFAERSSNAATVTINTSGDLGARICGARDLVQMTTTKQPALTAGGYPFITFDGTDDYIKCAAFALAQPTTVYFVGQQVTWSSNDVFYDGNGTSNRNIIFQQTSTPTIAGFAGSAAATNSGLPVATNAVISAVFNNASSSIRINKTAPTTGTLGTQASNGFLLGAAWDASAPANILVYAVLIYNTAHDTEAQNRFARYAGYANGIAA